MTDLLLCNVCGRDVGEAYVEDNENGWLVWWEDTPSQTIKAIHTCCHGPMDREGNSRCLRRLETTFEKTKNYNQLDHHLHMFCGDRAIFEMWRLQRDYPRWDEETSRQLVLIFSRLQKLPTWAPNRKRVPRQTKSVAEDIKAIAKQLGGVDRLLETIGQSFDLHVEGEE